MATSPENSPGGEEEGEEKEEQRSWDYEQVKVQSYKEVVENAPAEFFTFKTTPKYGNKTMCVMSLVSYLAPLATFIALIVIGARSVTTVTKISTTDITDDTWTCEMISKVTEEVQISANSSFALYAVLESQSECESNLKSLNCGAALADTSGSASTTKYAFSSSIGVLFELHRRRRGQQLRRVH
jgi:hypothetical protein